MRQQGEIYRPENPNIPASEAERIVSTEIYASHEVTTRSSASYTTEPLYELGTWERNLLQKINAHDDRVDVLIRRIIAECEWLKEANNE